MPEIVIYTRFACPYCYRAKRLLDEKGAAYAEFDIGAIPGKRQEMLERANGRHTVPQIFIGDRHVGGSDDLMQLERAGELDALLASG